MVEVYARAILNGLKSFEDVPKKYQEQVKERLQELGFTAE